MKRFSANAVIALFLSALAWGLVAHTVKLSNLSNPFSYFVVWDMFCGWDAYSKRYHLVAEGESGKFYEVTPAPWGEFKPYGPTDRLHYDTHHILAPRVVRNVLTHTDHEPINRVFAIEEVWPKQFNLPDSLWNEFYTEPKDLHSYFNLLSLYDSDGQTVHAYPTWHSNQVMLSISDNPKLHAQYLKSKPFYDIRFKPQSQTNSDDGRALGN